MKASTQAATWRCRCWTRQWTGETCQLLNLSPELYSQIWGHLNDTKCSNCVLFVKQLHSALEVIESAKLIIKLLQKEGTEYFSQDNRINEAINSPSNMSAIVYWDRLDHNTWTVFKLMLLLPDVDGFRCVTNYNLLPYC
jgi:hypothetical protein